MTQVETPRRLKGKEFEELLVKAAARFKDRMTMSRYGTMSIFQNGQWRPVPSLPDFEGVFKPDGRQFIVEAKVCTKASFALEEDKFKMSQYRHMARRSDYGVPCYLLIHFNERVLKKSTDPAFTVRLIVDPLKPLWMEYATGETVSISRERAVAEGVVIPWVLTPRSRKPIPAFL